MKKVRIPKRPRKLWVTPRQGRHKWTDQSNAEAAESLLLRRTLLESKSNAEAAQKLGISLQVLKDRATYHQITSFLFTDD